MPQNVSPETTLPKRARDGPPERAGAFRERSGIYFRAATKEKDRTSFSVLSIGDKHERTPRRLRPSDRGSVGRSVREPDSQRIWEKDYTVWRPIPDEIANRLGWLDAPAETKAELGRLTEAAGKLKADGVTKVLLLGMGGSSLCPEVLSRTFGSAPGYPTLDILDSTHPDAVRAKAAAFPPAETVYVVASKSGTTVEPLSFFKYFYNLAQAELERIRPEAGSSPLPIRALIWPVRPRSTASGTSF